MKNKALLAALRRHPAGKFGVGLHYDGSPAFYDVSTDGHLVIAGRTVPGRPRPWVALAETVCPDWDVYVANIFGGYEGDGSPSRTAGTADTFEGIADLLEHLAVLATEREAASASGPSGPRILLIIEGAVHVLGDSPGAPAFEREARARSITALDTIAWKAGSADVTIILCSQSDCSPVIPSALGKASRVVLGPGIMTASVA